MVNGANTSGVGDGVGVGAGVVGAGVFVGWTVGVSIGCGVCVGRGRSVGGSVGVGALHAVTKISRVVRSISRFMERILPASSPEPLARPGGRKRGSDCFPV